MHSESGSSFGQLRARRWRIPCTLGLALFLHAGLGASPRAQTPPGNTSASPLSRAPRAWAELAGAHELQILNDEGSPLLYRVHKVDAKGDTTRQLIESRDGTVARLLARDQAPLTADENTAERDRLNDILDSPSSFLSHRERDRAARGYAAELLRSMPAAMLWSYAPGQPQRPGVRAPEVVLDFHPDPAFKPPTLVTEGLTGIAGRIWVDPAAGCVTRIQGSILHPVNFGWGGVLARVGAGGTVAFDQAEIAPGRWLYTSLSEHLTIREVLVRTVHEDTEIRVTDAHPLSAPLSLREAVQRLLALPVATR